MKTDSTIRTATENDLDSLTDLWLELMIHHKNDSNLFQVKEDSRDGIQKILKTKMENKNTQIFVSVLQSKVLGFIVCSFQIGSPIFNLYKKGYIAETVIHSNCRGQGIGKNLYSSAEEWLKKQGVDHIQLQVSVKNPKGIDFWSNQGFEKVTFSMNKEV